MLLSDTKHCIFSLRKLPELFFSKVIQLIKNKKSRAYYKTRLLYS